MPSRCYKSPRTSWSLPELVSRPVLESLTSDRGIPASTHSFLLVVSRVQKMCSIFTTSTTIPRMRLYFSLRHEHNMANLPPRHFYTLAKEILPVTDRCSPTHAFIRLLQDKQKLLTNYTQNIDNIEAYAGIDPERLIQCHGSWATASCRKCQTEVNGDIIFEDVRQQRVSFCQTCLDILEKQPRKRKRTSNGKSKSRSSHSDSEDDGRYDVPQPGVMKVRPDQILASASKLIYVARYYFLRREASRPLLRQTHRARRRRSRSDHRHRHIDESCPCL
jgi:hypothetical protein